MHAELLRKSEVFRGFDGEELTRVAAVMRPMVLPPHRVLYRRGDAATGCYVLLGGMIEVTRGGSRDGAGAVAWVEQGALFGEVSLVDGGPRTVTCVAGSQGARLAFLSRADYLRLSSEADSLAFKLLDRIARAIVGQLQSAPMDLQRAMLCRAV
jgi:CRP-like cAMP-binding protein